MKIISSEAGERFARAKLALTAADQWERSLDPNPERLKALSEAHVEFTEASHQVPMIWLHRGLVMRRVD